MNNALVGSGAGGAMLAGLGLLIRNKRHHWFKIRSVLFLLAGLGLIVPIGVVMNFVIGLVQKGLRALGTAFSGVPVIAEILGVIATGIPWIIGGVLTLWWVLDMWPKHGDPDDKTGFVGLFVPAAWALLPPLAAMLQVG